jgi:hypothetical protein
VVGTGASNYPGQNEVCDGQDNDCNSLVDDAAADATTWYPDSDGDSYGATGSSAQLACSQPAGTSSNALDCDDLAPAVNPGEAESCDGQDNDCNNLVDEGLLGQGASCAAQHCQAILDANPSASDGVYWIDPDNSGVVQSHCDMTASGGGWTRVVNAVPVSLSVVQVTEAVVLAGQGSIHDDNSNGWLGLSRWNSAAPNLQMLMKCSGSTAGTVEAQASFQLQSQAPYALTWDTGCFGGSNSGRSLTTSDHDRDSYSGNNCATYSGSIWPTESHGWGWHNSCHCGSYWNGSGSPACSGVAGAYFETGSNYVQVYVR